MGTAIRTDESAIALEAAVQVGGAGAGVEDVECFDVRASAFSSELMLD
jgi:hypothetical protein